LKRCISYILCISALVMVIIGCLYAAWYILYGYDYTYGTYEINITAFCVSNDSVGEEWVKKYIMDGNHISSVTRVTAPLNKPTVKIITATLTEIDKNSESATKNIAITLDNEYKTTNSAKLTIIENSGRYKGNSATWQIIVSARLVERKFNLSF